MKLKNGFVLREVAGDTVVVPAGAEVNFNGMITLNETAKTLWLALEKDTDIEGLTNALLSEFEVDEATAKAAAEKFVEKLKGLDFLE